jgi:hypothetical protein
MTEASATTRSEMNTPRTGGEDEEQVRSEGAVLSAAECASTRPAGKVHWAAAVWLATGVMS